MAAPLSQSQPLALMDELMEEILLRLLLDEPAQLVRAALVCKLVSSQIPASGADSASSTARPHAWAHHPLPFTIHHQHLLLSDLFRLPV